MAQKQLNGRIALKHDLEVNWVAAAQRSNFTPNPGEVIIYDPDENHAQARIKIGDGVRNVEELPFYAGSWNDLSDKPFGENNPIEITWDGVIGDNFVIEEWAGFGDYYIGDYGITDYTQLLGGTVKLGDNTYTLDYCDPPEYSDGYSYTLMSEEESYAKVILYTENPYNYPVGIYFYYTPDTYVSYLKTNSFEHSTIKTLDSKFIGDDIARVSEVVSKDDLDIAVDNLEAKIEILPDWNQNDETALDYIKNRPFYEAAGVEVVDIPETTLSNFEEEYWSSSKPDTVYYRSITTTDYYVDFSLDKTYTVIWDGIIYDNVTCEDTMGGPMIGSTERQIAGVYGESNQYPFGIIMQYIDDAPELCIIAEEGGTHTVKVASMSETYIKTLDPKFLPELVGKYTDVARHSEIFNDYENNIADGYYSHAEGEFTAASGGASHAEGLQTIASGDASHAEGWETVASGTDSHAEGFFTEASGANSHAEGIGTIAKGTSQHVQGKYNIANKNTYAHIVGNGDSDSSRSNAHTVDWDGNANFAGDVYVGNANENKAGKKLATEEYVDNTVSSLDTIIATDENSDGNIVLRPYLPSDVI